MWKLSFLNFTTTTSTDSLLKSTRSTIISPVLNLGSTNTACFTHRVIPIINIWKTKNTLMNVLIAQYYEQHGVNSLPLILHVHLFWIYKQKSIPLPRLTLRAPSFHLSGTISLPNFFSQREQTIIKGRSKKKEFEKRSLFHIKYFYFTILLWNIHY